MAKLEIFQNGTSMHPDTMGNPIYQIGTKNADGEYDVVVFDAMSEKEAKAKLKELNPVKAAPKPKPKPEPKPEIKKKNPVQKKAAPKKKIVSKKVTKKKTAKKK
tara:strand:- start:57 stop:368 length:312 start_codon:yes stop_codon:yes gene_type:complete